MQISYERYNSTPLSRITNNYVEKSINSMLIDLLGVPGAGAGKAEPKGGAYEASMGYNTPSAYDYTSAQARDAYGRALSQAQTESNGGSSSGDWIAAGIGLIRDVLGYAHADKSAKRLTRDRMSTMRTISLCQQRSRNMKKPDLTLWVLPVLV